MQPTPWTPAEIPDSSSDLLLRRARRSVGAAASALAGRGAGVCIVVGGLATLMLLFQPWLVAGGYDGTGQVNAFGTLRATTTYLNYSSSAPPPGGKISGLWGL
ncbi:MAG: hypothetical protein HOQ24_16345, partial [Mycobacteriaceae bacterium]|nr:hypothetical protein [Mycobacteriaceae bacterium]